MDVRLRRAALMVSVGLAAGCTTYVPRPIVPTLVARQFEQRSLASKELRAYVERETGHDVERWPPVRFNREMLTWAALYYNPAIGAARAQWATAKADIDVADTIPNPTLQLPFQYSTPNSGSGSPFTFGPVLDIPIETVHKRGYRVDQATHLSEAARLNIINESWKVRAQVRDAMLDLYAARKRISILSAKAGASQQIAEMSKKRLAVGQFSRPDVDSAILGDSQAQSDLAAARSAEQDVRARLAATIGVPVHALDGLEIDLSVFGAVSYTPADPAAQRAAIFQRADLLASLADYAAAESALQLEVARQYPDIHLGPGYTYDVGTQKFAFGLAGISLPIFNRNQDAIHAAEARREEAAARTAALQDKILGDLAHAMARCQSSIEALHLADAHLARAQKQSASQAAAFADDNADRLTYTQEKLGYLTSEAFHLDAVVAAQQAAGALEDAMQQPLGHELRNATRDEEAPK
jgi:outer membrane protein TolC